MNNSTQYTGNPAMELLRPDATIKTKWICPRCKTDTQADRINRNILIKLLLGWLIVSRYICYRCKRSYYSFKK